MKKLLVLSLAFVLIISALLLLSGCKKECDHSYERTVITPPTCTKAGEEKFSCTKCDYYYTTKIEAIGTGVHNVQNGVCTVCGGKESTPGLSHRPNHDGTYKVIGKGTCTETDIVIGIYNNRDVTTIDDRAFYYCRSLTSIELPDSLTTIGDRAFRDCHSLTSIVIPEGVTTIGKDAFYGCKSLTNIVIPEGVTTIGEWAFSGCKSLTSIVIPEGVTTIGEWAFSWCYSLTSIELPDSFTTIGDNAFYYCTSLKSIVIPEGVTTIGGFAFSWCDSLKSIVIPEGVTTIGDLAFDCCPSLTIYCEVAEKPDGWSDSWNNSGRPVIWGYKGE